MDLQPQPTATPTRGMWISPPEPPTPPGPTRHALGERPGIERSVYDFGIVIPTRPRRDGAGR